MKTAIDTNAISALWSGEPLASEISPILADAHRAGALTISAPVYSELLAYPAITAARVDEFLASTGIDVDFRMDDDVWRLAGQRFAAYAVRRRKSRVGPPKRLLVDFIIGAHALRRADCLLTMDTERYTLDFPELEIVSCE